MVDLPNDGRLVKLARWVGNNGPIVAKEGGPYLFGIAGLVGGGQLPKLYEEWQKAEDFVASIKVWVTSYSVLLIVASVLLAVVAICMQTRQAREQQDKLRKMESQLHDAKDEALQNRSKLQDAEQHISFLTMELDAAIKEFSESYLRRIMRDNGLDDDAIRISLYGHDRVTKSFVLAGRYSIHPEHNTRNRQKLPDDQGFLSQAWTNGGRCFIELDDFDGDVEYKQRVLEKCVMDEALVDALRMKSRVYFGKAVSDQHRRTGIVMIESTRKGALKEQLLFDRLTDSNDVLNDLVRRNTLASPFMTYPSRAPQ